MKLIYTFLTLSFIAIGCAGVKVIDPNDKYADTKMLDVSGGNIKVINPYVCRMSSQGHRFSAIGKTEEEARTEVLARCQDRTLISICKASQITCTQNN